MPADAEQPPTGMPVVTAIGDDLLAIQVPDTVAGQALAARLRASGAWLEAVAGIDSVVARFDNLAHEADAAAERLRAAAASAAGTVVAHTGLVEIPVAYGGEYGPDLDSVCAAISLSPEAFIARHTAQVYRVDMLGFTPGFAYLNSPDADLDVPRREMPRQRVPAGSVGIAGGRTGLYALSGPGGWSVVGRTPVPLFDAGAEEPFLLDAGMRVRFVAIDPDEFRKRATT